MQPYVEKGSFAELLESELPLFSYQLCCMLSQQLWEHIQEVNHMEIWGRMFQEERISRTMAVEQRSRSVYGAGRSPSSWSGLKKGKGVVEGEALKSRGLGPVGSGGVLLALTLSWVEPWGILSREGI